MNIFIRPLDQATSVRALVDRMSGTARIVGNPERSVQGLGALSPGHRDALTFCDCVDAQGRLNASLASVIAVPASLQPAPERA